MKFSNQRITHSTIKFTIPQERVINQLPVSSSITSILMALYRGQSADPIFSAAHGLVTMDFREVACRLLLSPTRYTESPRHRPGSVEQLTDHICQHSDIRRNVLEGTSQPSSKNTLRLKHLHPQALAKK